MKNNLILLLSIMLIFAVFMPGNAQEKTSPVFAVEAKANTTQKTGDMQLNEYLQKNLVCPQQAADCCKEGTEIVQFTVTKYGNVKDFEVINSVCSELDKEIIRVLKTTNGMWNPANRMGEPVAASKEVAFMFGDYSRNTIANNFVKVASQHYTSGSKYLIEKKNPRKALRHFNIGINYMPNDKALLALRGLCHLELGDAESGRRDFQRIATLGGVPEGLDIEHLAGLKGFHEMKQILALKK